MRANRRQADAAESQLGEMKREQMLSERAWVVANNFEARPSGEELVFFRVTYKNTGKTPAINGDGVGFFTTDLTQIPTKDTRPTLPPKSQLLAPEAAGAIDIGMFPKRQIWDVKTNGGSLYLYGTFWYDDVFGSNHWSQFCVKVVGSPEEVSTLSYLSLPFHNSCDDVEANQKKK
jgi:hypothetical protein